MTAAAVPVTVPFRRHGHGPARVLLLHALTGTPDAADRPGVKGWWGPLFTVDGPLAEEPCTVWTPALPAAEDLTVRDQAAALAAWLGAEDLRFDLLLGGSLGGMVALELALQAPDRIGTTAVIGCGGRSDAWVRGQVHAERRILESALPDA
ncbi:MAG TPA: alpha/beta fold hydrolase, partial [Holophagaceae bacterium]|nr:alpha/beta fold hydrolase [Holophagaceae bacterium]